MSGSLTRRGILTGAAVIAGVTVLPQFLMPASAARSAIGHVVVDDRLVSSAAFAGGFFAPTLHHVDALNDLCNRWYTRLRREVLADAGHLAGLTSWMDYVVMRSCAAEIGYVGAFHAEHVPGASCLEHRVTAHPDLLKRLASLAHPELWAQTMGEALATGAHLRSRFVTRQVFSATTAAASSGHVRMVTWVFSPRN